MKSGDSQKKRAIAEVLAHGNVKRAAKAAGVHRATVHRWKKKGDAVVKSESDRIAQELHGELVDLVRLSLKKLRKSLKSKKPLSAPQLAVVAGILADKVVKFAPPREEEKRKKMRLRVVWGGSRLEGAAAIEAEASIVEGQGDDAGG